LTDEHSTFMKGTTFTISRSAVRLLKPDVAFADWDVDISGMHSPDGTAMPTLKNHVSVVLVKKSGQKKSVQWWIVAARPVSYLPPPGSARSN
jgi:hypothetical protein